MILKSSGINWDWYLDCDIAKSNITINAIDRFHYTDNHPTAVGGYQTIESDPVFVGPWASNWDCIRSLRIAVKVQVSIGGVEQILTVTNPQYVFSYKGFPYGNR